MLGKSTQNNHGKPYNFVIIFWKKRLYRGGGVLRFELDRGVLLKPQNPYPSLRVILAEKGTHF